MGSQPQLLLPQDVSPAQVQSQSQPFPTSQEVNNTEVEQVLSQKMEELSSQEKPDIEIEAGFCGDFNATVTDTKEEDNKDVTCNVKKDGMVLRSAKRAAAADDSVISASPTKKAHQEIEDVKIAATDFPEPLAASTQSQHFDEGQTDSQKPISQKQEDPAAEKTASPTVLTQEIPSQIPGFVDCAEEELQSQDSAEIVEEMLASIKDEAAAKKGEES